MNTLLTLFKGGSGLTLLQMTEQIPNIGDGLDTIVKCITQIIVACVTLYTLLRTNKKNK